MNVKTCSPDFSFNSALVNQKILGIQEQQKNGILAVGKSSWMNSVHHYSKEYLFSVEMI